MSGALPSGLLVSALVRRVNDAGGMGMVRAKGDPDSGTILLILSETGDAARLFERVHLPGERPRLQGVGPDEADLAQVEAYWRRRRARDPDLWVVELSIAAAERFAAETICDG